MSDVGENYGRKGSCLGIVLVGLALFFILLIWLYNSNPSSI